MHYRSILLAGLVVSLGLTLAVSVQGQFLQKNNQRSFQKKRRPGAKPGERNTPPARGERVRTTLKVGDPAPDFSLPTIKGNKEIKLSSFEGKKPVVLIFGSYT